MEVTEGLRRAIRNAGGQAALARRLGVSQQLLSGWVTGAKRIRAERVLKIEKETGIPRHELRPDLYPLDAA
jgi:DNA-binding transcriptional regulator YdaS (Cro superfamily)